jgi:hypothetical protein
MLLGLPAYSESVQEYYISQGNNPEKKFRNSEIIVILSVQGVNYSIISHLSLYIQIKNLYYTIIILQLEQGLHLLHPG